MPKTAMAMPRFCGGKLSMRMAWDSGWSAPPAAPWSTRASTSMAMVGAAPQAAEARVKPVTQSIRKRLRPNVLLSHPVMGSTMALLTR